MGAWSFQAANFFPLCKNAFQVSGSKAHSVILEAIATSLSSHLKGAKLLQKQACYLPCSPDGIPIIGKLPCYKDAYVGTGHGVWGILNGPATGKCLAQVILDIKPDIDLTPFS